MFVSVGKAEDKRAGFPVDIYREGNFTWDKLLVMVGHVAAKSPMSKFETFVKKTWGENEEPAISLL